MTTPAIRPEELASGYRGWLETVLSSSRKKTLFNLGKTLNLSDAGRARVLSILAGAAGITPVELMMHHTLLPFFRAFSPLELDAASSRAWIKHGTRISSRWPQFCQACVSEDLEFCERSYWRRSHQILGVDYCEKHGALTEVKDHFAFSLAPERHAHTAGKSGSGVAPSEFERRYANICSGLLDIERPFRLGALLATVGSKCADLGLRRSATGSGKSLPQYVQSKAPGDWLSVHFPDLAPGQDVSRFENLFAARVKARATELIILFCATIFRSADEFFLAIRESELALPPDGLVTERPTFPPGFWTSAAVVREYTRSGCDVYSVASHFNLDKKNTARQMASHGYPPLVRALGTRAGEALQMFLTGAPLSDAIAHAGCERGKFEILLGQAASPLAGVFNDAEFGSRSVASPSSNGNAARIASLAEPSDA